MALSNEEIIAMVKDKLEAKNRTIQERDKEIASLTGIPIDTVSSRLYRIKKKLFKTLSGAQAG